MRPPSPRSGVRYIRQDFFLGRTFRNLDDLNAQLVDWLAIVANVRVHATTRREVAEAFAEEKSKLQELPSLPFGSVLKLERRVSHEGMVSVGGNLYSMHKLLFSSPKSIGVAGTSRSGDRRAWRTTQQQVHWRLLSSL
jgi:hypothetical protein